MSAPADIRKKLVRIGTLPDAEIGLAESALVLSSIANPGASVARYLRHVEKIAADVAAYSTESNASLELQHEALAQVIARRYGYGGADDTHDEPESACLMRVIDRRHGMPVVLGILYIEAARRAGWLADGIDFPARFLVRLEHDGERLLLDPFDGGLPVEPHHMRSLLKAVTGNQAEITPDHYQAMGNRDILLRVQNNIKLRQLRADRLEDALGTVETMLLFAPDVTALWREAGLLNARLDRVPQAVAALEEYLKQNSGSASRYRTSVLLQELRGRLT